MSTFRTPVGPQPSTVYWRRRLLVLFGLLAVIIVIVLIVSRPGGGTPASTATPPVHSVSTSSSTSTANATACDPKKIMLEAVTNATSYDPGVNPLLSFTLKSTALTPCTLSAGTDTQQYKITSGSETIWNSKDCQSGAVATSVTLQPGVPLSPAAIPWDRTRSATDTCTAVRSPVVAGGASYHLTVTVGTLMSTDKQFLLN